MENQPRKFKETDIIKVENISNGTLIYKNNVSGETWIFEKPGDIHDMNFRELIAMRSAYVHFFRNKWVKVLDDDAVRALRIQSFYED